MHHCTCNTGILIWHAWIWIVIISLWCSPELKAAKKKSQVLVYVTVTNVPGNKRHILSVSCDIYYHVSAVSLNHTKLNIVKIQSDWLTAGTPILLSEGHNYINSSQKRTKGLSENNFHYIFMQSFFFNKFFFGCFYGLSCYPRSKFFFTTGTLVSGDVLKCQIECNRWLWAKIDHWWN